MSAQYKEELPDGCPPLDAEEINSVVFYRLVATLPPTDQDFLSLKALNPSKPQRHECEARALSVFVKLEGAHAALKLPTQRGKKVAKLTLGSNTGKHKRTFSREHHHSWWVYSHCNPITHCEAVHTGEDQNV